MKAQYEQLYEEMIAEISWCRQVPMPEPEIVASCFWVAKNYWEQVKRKIEIKARPFKSEAQEIIFFRNIKPKFTAQIQYFATLSEALLFVPSEKEDQVAYWQKEMERYKWFCDKHKEFVDYYESGSCHLDNIYFIKMSVNMEPVHPLVSYDADREFCSSYDHLVRSLLAHKMYNEYCKKKLAELVGGHRSHIGQIGQG
jgi:hypothetical protein